MLTAPRATSRRYATIPAGQRVDERTFPGQCWRARTPKENGGQHVSSYCATSAAEQVVRLQPQEKVNLDFHYPAAAAVVDRVHEPTKPTSSLFNRSAVTKPLPKLNKASVFIVSAATSSGASDSHSPAVHAAAVAATEIETLVGHVAAGDHLVTSAAAGAVYRVRDSRTRQPLLPRFVAGSEAEQHVDITASQSVILEFTLGPATAAGDGAALYWTWGACPPHPTPRGATWHALLTPLPVVPRVRCGALLDLGRRAQLRTGAPAHGAAHGGITDDRARDVASR